MPKFGKGQLHSGSPKGPAVKNPKQAVAIMLSEKGQAKKGKKEYQAAPSLSGLHSAING
jgi:hypothetical protein